MGGWSDGSFAVGLSIPSTRSSLSSAALQMTVIESESNAANSEVPKGTKFPARSQDCLVKSLTARNLVDIPVSGDLTFFFGLARELTLKMQLLSFFHLEEMNLLLYPHLFYAIVHTTRKYPVLLKTRQRRKMDKEESLSHCASIGLLLSFETLAVITESSRKTKKTV